MKSIAVLTVAGGILVSGCAVTQVGEAINPEMAPQAAGETGIAVEKITFHKETRTTHYTVECSERKYSRDGSYCYDLEHVARSRFINMHIRNDSPICYEEIKIAYRFLGTDGEPSAEHRGLVKYVAPDRTRQAEWGFSYDMVPGNLLSGIRITSIEPGSEDCEGRPL